MIGKNRNWMMNVIYVIYMIINIFIGMVALNLIPFPRTPISILLLFVMLVGAMKRRMQNKRRAMEEHKKFMKLLDILDAIQL
ncbi:hypothetical protein H5410_027813 [Solanum commersonii]|uniref:Uncharacterized protein n=1 Tax=Solanum commersonii TaxID=4109 RepID=A0A9J5Z085_SOLCO|nr:hypothetical protein H5410_027813 [Solanum commersonii]